MLYLPGHRRKKNIPKRYDIQVGRVWAEKVTITEHGQTIYRGFLPKYRGEAYELLKLLDMPIVSDDLDLFYDKGWINKAESWFQP